MSSIERSIDEAINSLSKDFVENPNKYLTEDDMRMHLCFRLMPRFGDIEETADGDSSIALHSEVRWWGEDQRNDRSDIVILDVSSMNVTSDIVNAEQELRLIPRKGYSASKALAAIELKFRRPGGTSDNEFLDSINSDINKLSEIQATIGANQGIQLVCRMVAFDKKSLLVNTGSLSDEINTTYKFANNKLR